MENGITRDWTPGMELRFELALNGHMSFAKRHHLMFLRDTLKYDGRSKEGKRALHQASLRLAIATDVEIWEIAELHTTQAAERAGEISGPERSKLVSRQLEILKGLRTSIREKGIDKEAVRLK